MIKRKWFILSLGILAGLLVAFIVFVNSSSDTYSDQTIATEEEASITPDKSAISISAVAGGKD